MMMMMMIFCILICYSCHNITLHHNACYDHITLNSCDPPSSFTAYFFMTLPFQGPIYTPLPSANFLQVPKIDQIMNCHYSFE